MEITNRHKNWDDSRQLINDRLTLNVFLKPEEDTEAVVKFFIDTIQWAGWNATPEHTGTLKTYDSPILLKQKIEEKRDSVEIGIDYEHQKGTQTAPH
jgi:hypothetical protein